VWDFEQVRPAVPGETKYFGVKAIYALTPCSEERARAEAANIAWQQGAGATRTYENIQRLQTAPQIEAPALEAEDEDDAFSAGVSVRYECELPDCFSAQTFEGDDVADCDAKAAKAGWTVARDGSGDTYCPEHIIS